LIVQIREPGTGQFLVQAISALGKEHLVIIWYEAGWTPMYDENKNGRPCRESKSGLYFVTQLYGSLLQIKYISFQKVGALKYMTLEEQEKYVTGKIHNRNIHNLSCNLVLEMRLE
jgi:hypothetical protein